MRRIMMGVMVAAGLAMGTWAFAEETTTNETTTNETAVHNALSDEEKTEGFELIFDGTTLNGWVGDTKGYVVEDGTIVCKPGGALYTEKDYADFVFRFEFNLQESGNNGIALRSPPSGNAAYDGMECQILDDVNFIKAYPQLQPWQVHASIYGVIAGKPNVLKKPGEWNTEEIVLCGRYVRVTVNGRVVIEGKLPTADKPTLDSPNEGGHHPGLDNETGRIGFCGHNDWVAFRNLRVREFK